mmetsp:Transcript_57118/g.105616  ORF Transcript_57118/g.105616 Transcript_57118/m.105616 type:complete len:119 (-) Transcript_57118:34-390(-)
MMAGGVPPSQVNTQTSSKSGRELLLPVHLSPAREGTESSGESTSVVLEPSMLAEMNAQCDEPSTPQNVAKTTWRTMHCPLTPQRPGARRREESPHGLPTPTTEWPSKAALGVATPTAD